MVWREGQEQPPASSHPPSKRKGRCFTGSLNVNHGGVSAPSLLLRLFALFLVLAAVRVKSFLLNVLSSNF